MKRFKGCLGVFLIFFFGVLFGCAITVAGINEKMLDLIRGGPDKITDGTVKWLKKDLKLDKEQEEMLHQITMDTRIKLRTIRQTTQPQVEQTLVEAADRVRGILNPDQVKKFDEMVQKAMKKWKASEAQPASKPEAPESQAPESLEEVQKTAAPPTETP
jgi:hypothetical protein